MADPATGLDRGFDPAAYSPIPTSPAAPADLVRREEADLQSELAALVRLGTVKQEEGSFAEAEECFRRALELGDRKLGPDNPDLIILLNDLTRLYLKQSAYGSAEPLLLRLLDLKRNKGEDHPEVATVLATLATVRQAMGMHESAEQLWRRVLDIRERTLAPNHFATASALEHLGDACAARGKIGEALATFQRALTIREKTLGNEHPSLRIARERIADLELQASEDTLDPTFLAATPSPIRYRLLPGDSTPPKLGISSTPMPAPQSRVSQNVAAKTSTATETRPTREKKSTLVIPRTYQPPAVPASEAVPEGERVEKVIMAIPAIEPASRDDDESATLTTRTVEYRDALESVREELEDQFAGETIGERVSRFFSSVMAVFGARQVVATITIVALGVLGVAVATNKHAFGESGQVVSEASATFPPSGLVPTAAARPIPIPVSNASNAESSSAKAAKPRVVEEHATAKKAPDKKPEPPARVSIPNLSTAVLSRLDSVAARAAAVGSHTTDPVNVQTTLSSVNQRRATFDDEQSNAPQRARLIGELPTPKVPAQVMDVEGEVRVRFNVDSLGRPVLESFSVVSSPNPLLTAAVRKVIPGMRFEPARSAGPDSRSIGDVVQIGFQFARSR
ncbi:MAG TPA: tetratricopeptide repeat protein [Gemmatimonadaceae bacterium]|nr:tetratricopeptide repeat protein [Gemmatimonadaceae bacterium]